MTIRGYKPDVGITETEDPTQSTSFTSLRVHQEGNMDEGPSAEEERGDVIVALSYPSFSDQEKRKYPEALRLDKEHGLPPWLSPCNLKVNPYVWKRFVERMDVARSISPWAITASALLVVPFIVCFMAVTSSCYEEEPNSQDNQHSNLEDDDDDSCPPLWSIVGTPIAVVQMILCCQFLRRRIQARCLRRERKALAKMKRTFLLEGYETEYMEESPHERYLRFRSLSVSHGTTINTLEEGLSDVQISSQDFTSLLPDTRGIDTGDVPYDPLAWFPLKGYWKRSRASYSEFAKERVDWSNFGCINNSKSSIEVSGTASEESMSFRIINTFRCSSSIERDGHAHGNTVQLDLDKSIQEKLTHAQTLAFGNETLLNALMEFKEYGLRSLNVRPIGVCSKATMSYYRNSTGSVVYKVGKNSMVVFKDLEDDHLTDADIIGGALDRLPPEDLTWIKYDKIE